MVFSLYIILSFDGGIGIKGLLNVSRLEIVELHVQSPARVWRRERVNKARE